MWMKSELLPGLKRWWARCRALFGQLERNGLADVALLDVSRTYTQAVTPVKRDA